MVLFNSTMHGFIVCYLHIRHIMYASLSNNVINDNDMTGCMFRALAASCAAAFVLSAKGQQILTFVTVMSISGSCAFLMDYNFFLSEPR